MKPIGPKKLPYNGGTPRHWNCRSIEVPITVTFEELGYDINEVRGDRYTKDGLIPSYMTMEKWLMGKWHTDPELLEQIFGKKKAWLFGEGKISAAEMIDQRGRPLTLTELLARGASLEGYYPRAPINGTQFKQWWMHQFNEKKKWFKELFDEEKFETMSIMLGNKDVPADLLSEIVRGWERLHDAIPAGFLPLPYFNFIDDKWTTAGAYFTPRTKVITFNVGLLQKWKDGGFERAMEGYFFGSGRYSDTVIHEYAHFLHDVVFEGMRNQIAPVATDDDFPLYDHDVKRYRSWLSWLVGYNNNGSYPMFDSYFISDYGKYNGPENFAEALLSWIMFDQEQQDDPQFWDDVTDERGDPVDRGGFDPLFDFWETLSAFFYDMDTFTGSRYGHTPPDDP